METLDMNTSSLPLRASRPSFRTAAGGLLHRIGITLEKVWSLSGVSVPAGISSSEAAHLPRGMVVSVGKSDGVSRLEMVQGTLWITSTPAGGDIILGPGEAYVFGDRWPYVIEGLSDAEFIVRSSAGKETPATS
jgi:hypothetical protein